MKVFAVLLLVLTCVGLCHASAQWYTPDSTFCLTIPDGWIRTEDIPTAMRARYSGNVLALLVPRDQSGQNSEGPWDAVFRDWYKTDIFGLPYMLVTFDSAKWGSFAWSDLKAFNIFDSLKLLLKKTYKIDYDSVGSNDTNHVVIYSSDPIAAPEKYLVTSKIRCLLHACWGRNGLVALRCYAYDSAFAQTEPLFMAMANRMTFVGDARMKDRSHIRTVNSPFVLFVTAASVAIAIWLLVRLLWRSRTPALLTRWRWGIAVCAASTLAGIEIMLGCRVWDQFLTSNTVLCLAIAHILKSRPVSERSSAATGSEG